MSERPARWDTAAGIGMTAVVAAAGRAIDTHRTPNLVNDPYAEALVAAAGATHTIPTRPAPSPPVEGDTTRDMSDFFGIRTRFVDDRLREATTAGTRQVVVLGSGLDTRAFRLVWPDGTILFEVDQPAILDVKRRVLDEHGALARCDHRPIPGDLRKSWPSALRDQGFAPSEPTVWVLEGLLYYLAANEQDRVLGGVDDNSASGSQCVMDDDPFFAGRMADPSARAVATSIGLDMSALLTSGPRSDPAVWMRERNWTAVSRTLADAAIAHGRRLSSLATKVSGPVALTVATKA